RRRDPRGHLRIRLRRRVLLGRAGRPLESTEGPLMDVISLGFLVLVVVLVVVVLGVLLFVSRLFRKVEQGKALIISKTRKVDVTFTGAVVLPVFHKSEIMDISVKTIDIERFGNDGLICQDNIRADIKITFFVRVNKTAEDVVKVAQAIGTARASDQQ